jgi:hypothetical protein
VDDAQAGVMKDVFENGYSLVFENSVVVNGICNLVLRATKGKIMEVVE